MLIIAVLVGARGLAEQVNIGLRDANTGLGLTAGFAMAFIAIIADRILRGWASALGGNKDCLLYTSPSPRDYAASRMPSSA